MVSVAEGLLGAASSEGGRAGAVAERLLAGATAKDLGGEVKAELLARVELLTQEKLGSFASGHQGSAGVAQAVAQAAQEVVSAACSDGVDSARNCLRTQVEELELRLQEEVESRAQAQASCGTPGATAASGSRSRHPAGAGRRASP